MNSKRLGNTRFRRAGATVMRTVARRGTLAALAWTGRLLRRHAGRILTFHSVDTSGSPISISPGTFTWQMRRLKQLGYVGVSLSEYLRSDTTAQRHRVVALTFDDGYRNFLDTVVPILQEQGFTATVFVVPGRVGERGCWQRMAGVPELELTDWVGLAECQGAGMEIGSHTLSHPLLTTLEPGDQCREIMDSKAWIQDRLGTRVDTFCYPYGDFDEQVAGRVAAAGYNAAVTTRFGYHRRRHRRFLLPRIGMNRIDPADHIAQRLYFDAAVRGSATLYARVKSATITGERLL